jgi:hypothetical protein
MKNLKGFYLGLSIYTFVCFITLNMTSIINKYYPPIVAIVGFFYGCFITWLMYNAFKNDPVRENE